jgi:hypothetical protein
MQAVIRKRKSRFIGEFKKRETHEDQEDHKDKIKNMASCFLLKLRALRCDPP